jgi:dipeptidyl aminopeptidase/acylaminoacyl peptidase
MLNFFPDNPDWAVQTMRLVAEAAYGGADVFECDHVARRIKPDNQESWYNEWNALAQRTEAAGRQSLAEHSSVTGRQRLFRASNYYRHADFFLPGTDERKRTNFIRASACFKDAAKLQLPKIETVQITCEGDIYDGYFCAPSNPKSGRWPAVLMLGGADSLAEELYFFGGSEVLERGIAVLLVDTPGRGSSVRLKKIYSRPDYEVPVKAAIDYLVSRPEVDPDRIGCVGVSMAGYYAPRGTAFEPRIKALVLWCACFDILEDLYEFYPPIRRQIQWILGATSDKDARTKLKDFNLKGIAQRITCPTLISHGDNDLLMNPAGARRLYDEIGSKDKLFKLWGGEDGGSVHCNYDNWSISIPFMFDWLQKRL